jgi:hypothetical protein
MSWVELLLPVIDQAVETLLKLVVIPLIWVGLQWFKNWAVDTWVKKLVVEGVMFAQEKYWAIDGEQRFEQAKAYVLERLNKYGIKVEPAWLDALIDATVKLLRDEFEDWYNKEE